MVVRTTVRKSGRPPRPDGEAVDTQKRGNAAKCRTKWRASEITLSLAQRLRGGEGMTTNSPSCSLAALPWHSCSTVDTSDPSTRAKLSGVAEVHALALLLRSPHKGSAIAFMKRWAFEEGMARDIELHHPVVRSALAWEIGFGSTACAVERWLATAAPETLVCPKTRALWDAELHARFDTWEAQSAHGGLVVVRSVSNGDRREIRDADGFIEGDLLFARILELAGEDVLGTCDGGAVPRQEGAEILRNIEALSKVSQPTTMQRMEAYYVDGVPGEFTFDVDDSDDDWIDPRALEKLKADVEAARRRR